MKIYGEEIRTFVRPGLRIEFTDRDKTVRQVYEFAERGTKLPIVVFGSEGCGKSAWLRQASEILRERL